MADKREVVFTGIGQSGDANIEHQKAGLLWNLDNWIYTTYNPFRIRWTPSGFLREPTGPNGGQWGLASDDDGKPWFVDAGGERGPINFQYPIHYGAFTPCAAAGRGRAGHAASGAQSELPAGDGERIREGFRRRLAGAGHRGHAGRDRPHADAGAEPEPLHRHDRAGDRPWRRAARGPQGRICSSPSRWVV